MADGAGRRVRGVIVSARIVLVLEGRADMVGRGLGESSRSLVDRNAEGLLRM